MSIRPLSLIPLFVLIALSLSSCASAIIARLQRPPPPAPEQNVWRDLQQDGTLK